MVASKEEKWDYFSKSCKVEKRGHTFILEEFVGPNYLYESIYLSWQFSEKVINFLNLRNKQKYTEHQQLRHMSQRREKYRKTREAASG